MVMKMALTISRERELYYYKESMRTRKNQIYILRKMIGMILLKIKKIQETGFF